MDMEIDIEKDMDIDIEMDMEIDIEMDITDVNKDKNLEMDTINIDREI